MLDAISQVLFNPKAFFKAYFEEENRYASRAAIVVALVAVLTLVVSYFSVAPMYEQLKDSPLGLVTTISGMLSAFIMVFIVWVVNSLIIRSVASRDVKPWGIAAFSMAPQILTATIIIVVAALFPIDIPNFALDIKDPEAFQAGMKKISELMQASTLGQVSRILNYVAMAWALLISYLGVKEKAGNSKALTVVAIIGAIGAFFVLLPILLKPIGG